MLKGVNKLIIEVSNPESDFFEKAIFFVKPDKRTVVTGEIKQSAHDILGRAGKIEPQKTSRPRKFRSLLKLMGAAGLGAAIMGVLFRFFG